VGSSEELAVRFRIALDGDRSMEIREQTLPVWPSPPPRGA
jgi:hypothetical protein